MSDFCNPMDCSLPGSSLPMGFPRQEYHRIGLPFPPPGDLPNPAMESGVSCNGRQILYHWTTGEDPIKIKKYFVTCQYSKKCTVQCPYIKFCRPATLGSCLVQGTVAIGQSCPIKDHLVNTAWTIYYLALQRKSLLTSALGGIFFQRFPFAFDSRQQGVSQSPVSHI